MIWVGILIGAFAGGTLMLMIMSIVTIAKKDDDRWMIPNPKQLKDLEERKNETTLPYGQEPPVNWAGEEALEQSDDYKGFM